MGRCPNNKNKGKKGKGLLHKQASRGKFLRKGDDMIYDALKAATEMGPSVAHDKDEDLPGMGQHYCVHCDRHFSSADVREKHNETRPHKRRVKLLAKEAPHTQLDADLASGMGKPDNGPRLRSSSVPEISSAPMAVSF
eukprot:TRINITY_DN18624_c0_g1_i1.p1 TRINITY_DN18624_c0_g1~~TRINITY_DN18624_c0_g1_i1.p1  ORF type:complete len:138 (+),score=10.71 TRINITY_DN18624_c0_g1_i1:271-684(+)